MSAVSKYCACEALSTDNCVVANPAAWVVVSAISWSAVSDAAPKVLKAASWVVVRFAKLVADKARAWSAVIDASCEVLILVACAVVNAAT